MYNSEILQVSVKVNKRESLKVSLNDKSDKNIRNKRIFRLKIVRKLK